MKDFTKSRKANAKTFSVTVSKPQTVSDAAVDATQEKMEFSWASGKFIFQRISSELVSWSIGLDLELK